MKQSIFINEQKHFSKIRLLKDYKDLLENDIISQNEFDTIKNKILFSD
jgi:hypothetical protein